MRYDRIAAFLLGCWILGGLFMAFVATQNFESVDRVLDAPPPQAGQMIDSLGHDSARQLLRYLAGEENRKYFESWETAQIIIGIALVGILFFGVHSRVVTCLAGVLLILTFYEHFQVTGQIISLGRSIDFVSKTAESAERAQFWKLHALYGVIEVLKFAVALVATGFLFFSRRGQKMTPVSTDSVDFAQQSR